MSAVEPEDGTLTFVGNATTIIRYGGFTLLTDPNFLRRGDHARLGYGLTTRRLKDPACTPDELPDLDAVVLSHLHDDHWDRVAEEHLDPDLPIYTTPAAARTLRDRGFLEAEGIGTWRHRTLSKGGRALRVTALPGRHGPGPLARLLPPVMGALLEFGPHGSPPDLRICVSGDTLMYGEIAEITRRHPGIDTGIVHLGGTRLLGVTVTMDGRQGADWVETVRCATVVPVHYDDYTAMKSPLSQFETELDRRGLGRRLQRVERGQSLRLAPLAGAAR
ncbi:MBL fold metallo-hydrolase [Actinomadura rayongensis]|uniref:MBL fold metallo-hydrolase n=1 Tax=Actinomadura rayongensis TaxID=1429076 RepID=A0A6I4W364_9ACTN|nr:MBL fold metallo-hydrolase [Actinomadura rayongensis]MXQ64627.1 MBL fold metallo-hydrolase [Actinomadura rayongensis]